MLKQKVAQNVIISLDYFIFQKVIIEIQKNPNWQKMTNLVTLILRGILPRYQASDHIIVVLCIFRN
jgi:hypothetical protein